MHDIIFGLISRVKKYPLVILNTYILYDYVII